MTFGRNIRNTVEYCVLQFHAGLLVITLWSLKLHNENNACIFLLLTGSVTRNFRHSRTR